MLKSLSVKVKHNLIDSNHIDLSSSVIPVKDNPEEVDQSNETLDLFKSSDQKQQVSMTFDLNVSEIDSSSEDNLSEDSKVVFNLEEDTATEEEISLNEMSNTIVKSGEEGDITINHSSVPSEANDSVIEDNISFKMDTDNQKNKEKVSVDFTESYTEENDESNQKIIHTLSLEDEELPDDNSCIREHITDDSILISETNEQKSNQFDSNASSILRAPIEDVKSSVDYEQKPITQSTTNSKAVQEQINRAQKRKERLQSLITVLEITRELN